MSLARLQKCIEGYWYSKPGPLWALYPLECIYRVVSKVKRGRESAKQAAVSVPVLVVGNISVGGTGKTPALITLVNFLVARGLKPGIVSRGYGRATSKPLIVNQSSLSSDVGEEPLLIFQQTGCPVSVHRDRHFAATSLLTAHPQCDVILADDGLQHYKLKRDFELALIDGERLFGNQHLLPLGPLREPRERLNSVDWIVLNQRHAKTLKPTPNPAEMLGDKNAHKLSYAHLDIVAVKQIQERPTQNSEQINFSDFVQALGMQTLVAIAAIGHPQAFFKALERLVPNLETHGFPDHHFWCAQELQLFSGRYLLCTSKDAVKITELLNQYAHLDASRWYCLQVELNLDEALKQDIYSRIMERKS